MKTKKQKQIERKEQYEKHKDWYKKYYQKNKEKIFEQRKERNMEIVEDFRRYKMNIGCSNCGYDKYGDVLEFHHVGKKEHKMTAMFRHYKLVKFREERKKCILLCANCHKELHYKDNLRRCLLNDNI